MGHPGAPAQSRHSVHVKRARILVETQENSEFRFHGTHAIVFSGFHRNDEIRIAV
jgi:hypothetical protein